MFLNRRLYNDCTYSMTDVLLSSCSFAHRRQKVCKSVWADKAPRLRRPRRRHRGAEVAEGGRVWEGSVPPLERGLCLLPITVLNFFMWNCDGLVRPEEHFCQQMLAPLHNMITITPSLLANPVQKRKWASLYGNELKKSPFTASSSECVASDFYSNSLSIITTTFDY